jgi:hypothetical protein
MDIKTSSNRKESLSEKSLDEESKKIAEASIKDIIVEDTEQRMPPS